MALIKEGIENVLALELSDGVWANGESVGAAKSVMVKWESCYRDKFYQVYVNGRQAGESLDTEQRQMVVPVPNCFEEAVRIEVFAISVSDVGRDHSSEKEFDEGQSGRIKISILRGQDLPAGSQIRIYGDRGSGTIDFSKEINDRPIWVWPAWQDKSGFGSVRFGEGDFGLEWAGSVGFGRGVFGEGPFGAGSDKIEWISEHLASGVYKFSVSVVDEQGNESAASAEREVVVTSGAKPAEGLEIESFDEENNELKLKITNLI